ncbi:hypothetical protein D9X30_1434 [Cupriavidus sp. U2]|nr:hypothetical protein D9X30_1434 [Cupriavidus sp. U2]
MRGRPQALRLTQQNGPRSSQMTEDAQGFDEIAGKRRDIDVGPPNAKRNYRRFR